MPSDAQKNAISEPTDEVIFDPVECPSCGEIEAWHDARGRLRCMKCDPPSAAAMTFFANAQTIQRRIERASKPKQRRRPIPSDAVEVEANPCPACGSTSYLDFQAAHDSIRRDCRDCGRTAGFPKWRGEDRVIEY